jgi:Fic family protein
MLNNKQLNKTSKVVNNSSQSVTFKTPTDINRYLIFELLVRQTRLTVGDIAKTLKLPKALASRQLEALEQINILEKETQGQRAYYKFREDNAVAQAIINF